MIILPCHLWYNMQIGNLIGYYHFQVEKSSELEQVKECLQSDQRVSANIRLQNLMIIIYNLSPLIVLVGDSFWGSNLQNYGTQSTRLTAANIVIINKN